LAAHKGKVAVGSRKCQTATATPAEPGELSRSFRNDHGYIDSIITEIIKRVSSLASGCPTIWQYLGAAPQDGDAGDLHMFVEDRHGRFPHLLHFQEAEGITFLSTDAQRNGVCLAELSQSEF